MSGQAPLPAIVASVSAPASASGSNDALTPRFMPQKAVLRILKELRDIERSPDSQFHLHYDEEDVTKDVLALITGSPGTPYAYGLFSFRFTFPSEYPGVCPKVIAETTNNQRTRFNPNIYASGKVCLSILGTWQGQAGENWSSAHGVLSVLISIQSLMCERPYHNEPGFEKQGRHLAGRNVEQDIEAYNRKITHETIRIAVCSRIEGYLSNNKYIDRTFEDVAKWLFMCYYRRYLDIVASETKLVTAGAPFARMPFEGSGNTMEGRYEYAQLETRLHTIFQALQQETDSWIRQSREGADQWTEASSLTYGNLKSQFQQIVESKEFDGFMDVALGEDDNPFVWHLTVFGRPATHYEEGVFRVRLVFHPEFPAVRPRVTFQTPFYHVNVSPDGYPYYRPERMDEVRTHLRAVTSFFTTDPDSDPTTHLNKEAAELFFGGRDKRKEYGRHARRCASRSTEYDQD
ncbi:hypothetical protein GGF32_000112 [Allomyces javanicus]|nr:hypothetical protein GGF32_000112 [Allomyces javanicus]